MNIKNEAMIEHLLMQGAIEVSGIDDKTGTFLYGITDKLKEVSPELYENLEGQFRSNMFRILEAGPKVMTWRINE